jgi:polyisoprenoid-binding protein YceI
MMHPSRRQALLLIAAAFAGPAAAAPRSYRLEPDGSAVGFTYRLSGSPSEGTMPVRRADLMLDFDRVSNSRAVVELDAAGTRTGFIFATEALKSATVLDTTAYPLIRFESTRIAPRGSGATVEGRVTIRDVTRPLVLEAEIYRRAGSAAGDLSRLTVVLTGTVSRSDFGASGYGDLVADRVDLRITARLRQAG